MAKALKKGKVNSTKNNYQRKKFHKPKRHCRHCIVNIGPNLAKKIPTSNKKATDYLTKHNKILETPDIITEQELKKAFSSMKANKSPGYDSIPPSIVKTCYAELIKPLKHIFSCSFKTGLFPDKMKIAKVTPVFESGDKTQLTNYRPISVLPTFSKLLERLMYNRIYDYLLKENLPYDKQYGFRSGISTEHAFTRMVYLN